MNDLLEFLEMLWALLASFTGILHSVCFIVCSVWFAIIAMRSKPDDAHFLEWLKALLQPR